MLLGLAAGKIGDLVFYRDGGEQRTRTRVIPKNPRSPLQMAQRVKIANVSAFYRLFSAVIRDAFTNLPSNQSGYNAFARQAIQVSPYVSRDMALRGSVLPAPYAVSKGVLQPISYSVASTELSSEFHVFLSGLDDAMTTVGALSTAIIGANPDFQNGDKIVCLIAEFLANGDSSESPDHIARSRVRVLTLDTASSVTLSSIGFVVSENSLKIDVPGAVVASGLAVIHVREDAAAGLMVSSAVMQLSEEAMVMYEDYRTEQSLNDAIASYGAGSESILRD